MGGPSTAGEPSNSTESWFAQHRAETGPHPALSVGGGFQGFCKPSPGGLLRPVGWSSFSSSEAEIPGLPHRQSPLCFACITLPWPSCSLPEIHCLWAPFSPRKARLLHQDAQQCCFLVPLQKQGPWFPLGALHLQPVLAGSWPSGTLRPVLSWVLEPGLLVPWRWVCQVAGPGMTCLEVWGTQGDFFLLVTPFPPFTLNTLSFSLFPVACLGLSL